MEKILVKAVFIGSCCLSLPTFAGTEETTTYGTPYNNNYEPLSFGDWNYLVHGVLPGGAASQVAGSEYSNYRASLAKKKARAECKAKEATRNQSELERKNDCIYRHTYYAHAQSTQCPTVVQATTQTTITVAGQSATATQVQTPRDTCRQQIDDQLNLNKLGCENDYVRATPPMNCDSIK